MSELVKGKTGIRRPESMGQAVTHPFLLPRSKKKLKQKNHFG